MLILGFEQGIIIGIALACAAFILQAARQQVAGRLTFVEQAMRARAKVAGISTSAVRRIRGVSLKGTLFFGNAGRAAGAIEHAFDKSVLRRKARTRSSAEAAARSDFRASQSPQSPSPSSGGRRYLILDCSDISSIDFSASELVAAAIDQLLSMRTTVAAVAIPENLMDHLRERGHSVWTASADAEADDDEDYGEEDKDDEAIRAEEEGDTESSGGRALTGRNSSARQGSSIPPSNSMIFGDGISERHLPPGTNHWLPLTEWGSVDSAINYIEHLCVQFHPSKPKSKSRSRSR